jgi:hypothetical protein
MTDALGGRSVSQVEQIIEVRGAAEAASIRKAGFRSSPTRTRRDADSPDFRADSSHHRCHVWSVGVGTKCGAGSGQTSDKRHLITVNCSKNPVSSTSKSG